MNQNQRELPNASTGSTTGSTVCAEATTEERMIPDCPPPPEALLGGAEALDSHCPEDWYWKQCFPSDVPFFTLPLLERLLRRPYHSVLLEGPFHLKKLVDDNREFLFRTEVSINFSGGRSIDRLMLCLGDGVFGHLDTQSLKFYAPTPQAADAMASRFRRYIKNPGPSKPRFYVISMDSYVPSVETVLIERAAPVTNEELALNYGDDFPGWEHQWRERLRRTSSGLTILFGPPGCGKTSYLRALMSRLLDQAVFFYVPSSEAHILSSPRFVTFWIEQTQRFTKRHKIAILEDAEDLLLPRDEGNRDRVSNLLNIADGLLGDHLKLHVIATTNVPITTLDPAIIRPGRLIGAREFRRLTRSEAQRLADAKGLALPEQDEFTLADVYCARAENDWFHQLSDDK